MLSNTSYCFDEVSLLVTVYNRSESLIRLLDAFENLNISFYEIVVSDDASNKTHLERLNILKERYGFKLITSPENKGLSNNINKGQDAVTGVYTLYVQEDFIPLDPFGEELVKSLQIMDENQNIDIITYYSYFPYPYLKNYKGKFLEKTFKLSLLQWNHLKFYLYGDHPHLRRSSFFQKFGRYDEKVKSDIAEYNMSVSFIKNNARALFHSDYNQLFEQKNSSVEPSMINRTRWRQSNNFLILSLRRLYLVYRLVKHSLNVILIKMNIE